MIGCCFTTTTMLTAAQMLLMAGNKILRVGLRQLKAVRLFDENTIYSNAHTEHGLVHRTDLEAQ